MKRGEETRRQILDAALTVARDQGLHAVTLRGVGDDIGRAHGGVSYYFTSQEGLREAVAALAIERRDARIIARLILDRHPSVVTMTRHERLSYLSTLA